MKNEALRREVARELQAVIILGRALMPLRAEKKINVPCTHREVETLEYLSLLDEEKLGVSASQLAGILRLDRSSVSQILKGLARGGYIIRRYDQESHRLLVELTTTGKEIARQAIESDAEELLVIVEWSCKHAGQIAVENFLQELRVKIVASLSQ